VPEPKVAKNRVHLDIKVAHGLSDDARRPRIEAETTRLMAAGAGVVQQVDGPEGYWVVMHDVEGNEFCVI
jgi:Glyoxalase-like domain